MESGAKVIGCVIAGNKAAGDGSGVCGGDAELLNCTVGNNVPAEKLTKTIDIGTSEANIDFWGVSFTSEIGYSHTPGKGFEVPGDEQHWVRPILIY